jgi:DNA-binding transcriptional regulator YiaG
MKRKRGDGLIRYLQGLFPGPPPEEPPDERLAAVMGEVIDAIKAKPGRTRRAVAEKLPHTRQLGEQAIDHLTRQGAVVKRELANPTRGGPLTIIGLYIGGSAPAPPDPVPGKRLRRLREELLIGQGEFAKMLGVPVASLRGWELSEAPGAWRKAIAKALDPGSANVAPKRHADEAREAQEALDERIIEVVRAHPGIPRWGLPRGLRPIDRPKLGDRLVHLIASDELHERPCDNGHGAGLFVGERPAELEVPPISPSELLAMRERAGLSQKLLAERIHAGVDSVNAWERGNRPIPDYRTAQLRGALAEPAPPEPAPIAAPRSSPDVSA